jgi:hypothetical protein
MLNQLILIFWPRLVLSQLGYAPQVVAAKKLYSRPELVPQESVWLRSQVPLSTTRPRNDTGLANMADGNSISRII